MQASHSGNHFHEQKYSIWTILQQILCTKSSWSRNFQVLCRSTMISRLMVARFFVSQLFKNGEFVISFPFQLWHIVWNYSFQVVSRKETLLNSQTSRWKSASKIKIKNWVSFIWTLKILRRLPNLLKKKARVLKIESDRVKITNKLKILTIIFYQ